MSEQGRPQQAVVVGEKGPQFSAYVVQLYSYSQLRVNGRYNRKTEDT
jgi:hypothetical protein